VCGATLPCSLVMIWANSCLRSLSSSRNLNRIAVRLASEVSRHAGNAAAAASITARASATLPNTTSPVTCPESGFVTGILWPAVPSNVVLFIQCWIALASVMSWSPSVFRDVIVHGGELVTRHLVGVFFLGEDRRHHHGIGTVIEPDFRKA